MPFLCQTEIDLEAAIAPSPPLVTPETSVKEAIALMNASRSTYPLGANESRLQTATNCVLVVKNDQLVGIFTERDALSLQIQDRGWADMEIAAAMSQPVITLRRSELTDIFTAFNLLQAHNLECLPILDESDRPIGALSKESLQQCLRPRDWLRWRCVSAIMTSQVVWAEPHTSLLELARLMADRRVNYAIVASLEKRENSNSGVVPIALGIVTAGDLIQCQRLELDFADTTAQTVMSTPLFAVRPDDSLWTLHNLMQERQVQQVVVTGEQGQLWGIATQNSLLQPFSPLELYQAIELLETKIDRLEAEKQAWRETRHLELEREVQARTAELQARVKQEQVLAEIANRIRSSLNLPAILETTVKEVRSVLGCDRVAIWQFQADGSAIAVAESAASHQPSFLGRQVKDRSFTPDLHRDWNPHLIVVSDIYTSQMADCHREFLQQLQIRAKILVPIVQGQTIWGILNAVESQAPRQWQPSEISLLQQLATQLAIAIQQAAAHQQAETELAERQRAEAALQFQIEFDRLLASISSRFVQCSPDSIAHSINRALQEIGEFAQVDTSYIFQYSDHQPTHSMTHEWVADGIPPQRQNLQNIPTALFPWATAILQQGKIVYIPRLADLPPTAAIDRQTLQQFGIRSSLTIPLVKGDRAVGFLGLASCHQERYWTDDNLRLLQIFAEILLNTLQRQQAERDLQTSERRYASLTKAAPVGIFRTDAVGNCLYVNDRWSRIAGLSLAEAAGMGWVQGIQPDDRDLVAAEWYSAAEENRPFQQEYRFQRPDGQVSWVFGQAVAEYDAKGEIIGYVGTITDISDRKFAEAALRDNEERLRLALSAANQGLYDLNIQTGEAIVNDEYALMLGYEPSDMFLRANSEKNRQRRIRPDARI
jgi:PAS domain S-box-containing protein